MRRIHVLTLLAILFMVVLGVTALFSLSAAAMAFFYRDNLYGACALFLVGVLLFLIWRVWVVLDEETARDKLNRGKGSS
jgi:hypothetical protein